MKRIIILVILTLEIIQHLIAQEKAEINFTYSDKTITQLLIKGIRLIGQDSTYSVNNYFGLSDLNFKKISLGNYRLEFITHFNDTIVENIEITKDKKYRYDLPDASFYKMSQDTLSFINKIYLSDSNYIQIFIYTLIGDLAGHTEKFDLYFLKDIAFGNYFKWNFGIWDFKFDYCLLESRNLNQESKDKLIKFIDLVYYSESFCPGRDLVDSKYSLAYIIKDKEYLKFQFCPEKDFEIESLIDNLRCNQKRYIEQ